MLSTHSVARFKICIMKGMGFQSAEVMKCALVVLPLWLMLSGCGRGDANNQEVLNKLDTIKIELASKQATTFHWAIANKNQIETAIFQLTRDKQEQFNSAEALSSETAEKVRHYDTLNGQLRQKQMEATFRQIETSRSRITPPRFAAEPATNDTGLDELSKKIEELSQKIADAKAPVADIIERRDLQNAKLHEQFQSDKLIAEYVKGRYELVVDSNEKVLYCTNGEVPDITEGVLAFLREKAKP